MSSARHYDQDKDSTLYVGNLDERATDRLVWEMMLQAGPVVNVHLPKDRVTQTHQGYGFVEFAGEQDADYASQIMNGVRMFGKQLRINKASADKRGAGPGGIADGEGQGVGAELFVGNLDAMVDEKVLFETFSRFGPLVAPPKISRDESHLSKGFGFISYAAFESSDDAIANMHGQYLMNKEVTVQYAYKKDGKGERHGDAAERALAAQAKKHGVQVAIPAMPAALVMSTNTPATSATMNGAPPWAGTNGAMPSYQPQAYQPQAYQPPTYQPPAYQPPAYQAPPQAPPNYNYGAYNPGYGYNAMPPPGQPPMPPGGPPLPPRGPSMPMAAHSQGLPPPPANSVPIGGGRNYNRSPMQTPPSAAGLPARPPLSMVYPAGPPVQQGHPTQPPPIPGFPSQPGSYH